MKLLLIMSALVLMPALLLANSRHVEVVEDNDFAEFEESDDGKVFVYTLLFGFGRGTGVVNKQLCEK